jgi:elongation factor Tu
MSGDPSFRMTVEDVFSIKGRGVVATGRVESGQIQVGDEIQIATQSGSQKKATVTGVEAFRKQLTQAGAGDNIGVLLRGVVKGDVNRGDILTGTDIDFTWKP